MNFLNFNKLNLLMLASLQPHRWFCAWSKSAFEKLDRICGTETGKSLVKRNYRFELCMD